MKNIFKLMALFAFLFCFSVGIFIFSVLILLNRHLNTLTR